MPKSKKPPLPSLPSALQHLTDTIDAHHPMEPTPDGPMTRRYFPGQKGLHTQVGICLYIAQLFQLNELLGSTQELKSREKMSDAEIARQIIAEFPDAKISKRLQSTGRHRLTVNQLRQQFNGGNLTGRMETNAIHSFRYNARGEPVDGRYGRRVLSPEEMAADRKRSADAQSRHRLRLERRSGQRLEWWYGEEHGESRVGRHAHKP